MTENKRFEMIITSVDGSFHYLDKITGEKITSTLELENKLNELNNENEQLKSEKEHYKKQVDELDGLLNKFEVTFEELEDILYMKRSRLE